MRTESPAKTILLVDDDEVFVEQTRAGLTAAGFAVMSASSLVEAEKMLSKASPDLVVADLMMEYLDAGFVLCHRVKRRNPKTPVVLVTSASSEMGMELESISGEQRSWIKADAILAKPVRLEQLSREIGRLLPT